MVKIHKEFGAVYFEFCQKLQLCEFRLGIYTIKLTHHTCSKHQNENLTYNSRYLR